MLLCFIRHRPYHPYCLLPRFLLPRRRNSKYAASATTAGIGFVVPKSQGVLLSMYGLIAPIFWNQKIKIAILTLATFAALC